MRDLKIHPAKNALYCDGHLATYEVKETTWSNRPVLNAWGTMQVTTISGMHAINFSGRANRNNAKGEPSKQYDSFLAAQNFKRISTTPNTEQVDKVKLIGQITASIKDPRYWSFQLGFANLYDPETSTQEFRHRASFTVEIVVLSYERSTYDPVLIVKAAIVRYGGRVDPVEFRIESTSEIAAFENQVKIGQTISVGGYITASPITLPTGKTITPRHLIISRHEILPEADSYNFSDIQEGIRSFYAYIEDRNMKMQEQQTSPVTIRGNSAPATITEEDIGF